MSQKSLFGSVSHFVNIGSWKAGSHTSNPLLLKAQSRQLFIGLWLCGFCYMETNGFGDHKPTNLIEASLWQAWVWVAWIERGQKISGTENLRRRIIRIYHWFKTQTSTLAFELDCDSQLNNPLLPTYRLSDLFMSWMYLKKWMPGISRE